MKMSSSSSPKSNGGETGIRTLDTLRYTRFPSVRLQPLGHLSAFAGLFDSNTLSAGHFAPSMFPSIVLNGLCFGLFQTPFPDELTHSAQGTFPWKESKTAKDFF